MTREEAIAQLKMDRDLANFNPMTGEEEPMNEDCRKSVEALDMAIKALEQQPCEDTISRQAAIDAIRASTSKYTGFMEMEMYTDDDAVEAIEGLPSAQPEQRWIPCSERLPEPDERVLVYTVANEYHVWDAMPHRGEGYEWEDEEGLYHSLYEVAMWLPLPEPYAERRQNG